jgi:phosphoribosylformylglycinamidine cyclo-ligase
MELMGEEVTYAKSGVDIEEVSKAKREILNLLAGTFKTREGKIGTPLDLEGHYAGLIELGNDRLLALHVDGVGTKVLVAQMMGKYDTVGIDVVAMCVNDLICVGAEPIALIDYLAVEKPDEEMSREIAKGLAEGALLSDVAVVGGETAIMPDVIKGEIPGRGFDLAAMGVGVVDRDKLITGSNMREGDVVVGLKSSGIHSNGLTLARKILFDIGGLAVNDPMPGSEKSVGEELLEPTKIYTRPILEVVKCTKVSALANITGGAFTKFERFQRFSEVGFVLNEMPEPPEIFKTIQRIGKVSDREMYKTFNMGIGFCIVCPPESRQETLKTLEDCSYKPQVIGEVTSEKGIRVRTPRREWLAY